MSLLWLSLVLATPPAPKLTVQVRAARAVLGELVRTARNNSRSTAPLRGDALTAALVRAAATSAQRLPREERGPGFLLALAVGLDTSSLLRRNLLVGVVWKAIETEDERTSRLAVLGKPTLHDRHDLAQHFAVSAGLTAYAGAEMAQGIGILKEQLDARPGGSGFSFADLAADLAGIALAEQLLARPERLGRLARDFTASAYCVPPVGLLEGLTREAFAKRFGSVSDPRFLEELKRLQVRVCALPGLKAE